MVVFNHFAQPGVNFTNILFEAFTLVDPKSVKKIYNESHFYEFVILAPKSCS